MHTLNLTTEELKAVRDSFNISIPEQRSIVATRRYHKSKNTHKQDMKLKRMKDVSSKVHQLTPRKKKTTLQNQPFNPYGQVKTAQRLDTTNQRFDPMFMVPLPKAPDVQLPELEEPGMQKFNKDFQKIEKDLATWTKEDWKEFYKHQFVIEEAKLPDDAQLKKLAALLEMLEQANS